jgi:hypothetical protein
MNLSKTAKRFLSSTMAIALAGGSVLAFRNSALAETPPGTPEDSGSFSFESVVAQECALVTSSDVTEYTATDVDLTIVGGTEKRTNELLAEDSIVFDCNTAKVDISLSDYSSDFTPTVAGGTGATDLTGSNAFKYEINAPVDDTTSTDVPETDTPIADQNTDADGDITFNVKSKWTSDGEELAAGTYAAALTVTVTAD